MSTSTFAMFDTYYGHTAARFDALAAISMCPRSLGWAAHARAAEIQRLHAAEGTP